MLQVSVCPQWGAWSWEDALSWGGACSRGVPGPSRGGWSQGVPGPGGFLVLGGAWSRGWVSGSRGCLVEIPPDSYCCGRYASYWNAFLGICVEC